MIIPILIGFVAISLSSYIYSLVAYDKKYDNNAFMAYTLAILAAVISVTAWTFLVRHIKEPNNIMVINCIWDVGVTIMVLVFPLFLFDFKIDTKTIVGCVISVIGIIIAKI